MNHEANLKKIDILRAEIDALGPLDPAQLKNIDEWYTVELTYTSNALEGNTLTRQETAQVIEKDISVEGKSLRELLEAKNHAAAIEYIRGLSRNGNAAQKVSLGIILDIHARILSGIDDANAGKLRTVPVRISGSSAIMPNPVKVPELMQDFISWIEKETVHRVRYAIEAHYKFVSIHPFTDGNGRTARLLMNLILNKAGYPALIIPKELRSGYVISLEKSQTTEETDEHNQFMYERMIDSMKEYIRMVTGDM